MRGPYVLNRTCTLGEPCGVMLDGVGLSPMNWVFVSNDQQCKSQEMNSFQYLDRWRRDDDLQKIYDEFDKVIFYSKVFACQCFTRFGNKQFE